MYAFVIYYHKNRVLCRFQAVLENDRCVDKS